MAYPDGTVPTDQTVHPTPVYETFVMGLVAIVLWRLRDRFRAGILFALYLIFAGAERFLVEFLRRNDDDALGLTQAQLLSIAMIAGRGDLDRRDREPRSVADAGPGALRGLGATGRATGPGPQEERVSPPSSGITAPVR